MFNLGYSRPKTSYNQQPNNTNNAQKVEDKTSTRFYRSQVNTVSVSKNVCMIKYLIFMLLKSFSKMVFQVYFNFRARI